MKRVPVMFLVLAVSGGCMAGAPDPIEDPPYVRSQRFPAVQTQAQGWAYAPQSAGAGVPNTNTKTDNAVVKASYAEAKPVVQLIDAELDASALIVRWSVKDHNFGPLPITVLYSERPEGPWRPLAANQENTGRYEGSVPPRLADTVYVRVQATDLAGNVSMSQTTVLRKPIRSGSSAARGLPPAGPALSVEDEK